MPKRKRTYRDADYYSWDKLPSAKRARVAPSVLENIANGVRVAPSLYAEAMDVTAPRVTGSWKQMWGKGAIKKIAGFKRKRAGGTWRKGGWRGGFGSRKGERKFLDVVSATHQVNTTMDITLLNDIPHGDGATQRVGRTLTIRSVQIVGRVQQEEDTSETAGVVSAASLVRLMIVEDMQANAAVVTSAMLLTQALPEGMRNLDNRDRFKVHYDHYWQLDPVVYNNAATTAFASFAGTSKLVKVFKKVNIPVVFNSTNGGGIGDIQTGALYMCWIGSDTAGTNTDCNFIGATRIRYDDQ